MVETVQSICKLRQEAQACYFHFPVSLPARGNLNTSKDCIPLRSYASGICAITIWDVGIDVCHLGQFQVPVLRWVCLKIRWTSQPPKVVYFCSKLMGFFGHFGYQTWQMLESNKLSLQKVQHEKLLQASMRKDHLNNPNELSCWRVGRIRRSKLELKACDRQVGHASILGIVFHHDFQGRLQGLYLIGNAAILKLWNFKG